MRILAVDPGVTTGVVVLDTKVLEATPFLVFERLLVNATAHDVARDARNIFYDQECEKVVIEEGPTIARANARWMNALDEALKDYFPDATWMRPTDWKPTPEGRGPVSSSSRHCKDAERMGLRYIAMQRMSRAS